MFFPGKVSLFTSFAATGNPNDNLINADLQNVTWEPLDSLDPPFKCLNITDSLEIVTFPESERLQIWDEMYKRTNVPLY